MPRSRLASPTLLGFFLFACGGAVRSGEVFLDPVFDLVLTQNVMYGTGAVGYGTAEGVHEIALHLDLLQPKGPSVPAILPAAIFIHGGGFVDPNPGLSSWMIDLARRGYVALSIDFRVLSDSPPPEIDTLTSGFDPISVLADQEFMPVERSNVLAAQINDAKNALAWLKANAAALRVDPDRVILAGASSGARVALALGIAEAPDDVAGVVSLLGAIPGNEYLVGSGDPPLALYAGLTDPLAPASGSIALANAAVLAGVPYQLYLSDGGHDLDDYFADAGGGSFHEQTVAFLYEHLDLGTIPGSGTVVPEVSSVGLFVLSTLGVVAPCLYRRRRRPDR